MNLLHQSVEPQAPAKSGDQKREREREGGLAAWQKETILRIDKCLDKLRRYREAVKPLKLEEEEDQ
jgi:hypothetical protein